jgi:hypothetical protein
MSNVNKNIELKELAVSENIDRLTLLVCSQNKLTDLYKIINFKNNNGSFLSLEYSNSTVNNKLLAICEKYNQDNFLLSSEDIDSTDFDIQHIDNNSITQNILLKDLIYKEKLSVRTTNVCEYNFLTDIKSILKYYDTNGDFLKLRNCGKKSNEELIGICKKYENLYFYEKQTYITEKPENPLIKKIDKLTTKQKAVLNNIIYSKFNQLSVRSINALSFLLQDSITVRAIKEEFFEIENYDFKKIKNVGELTKKEIETFTNEVKELIELVSLFEDNEILREFFNSYLIKNYQFHMTRLIKLVEITISV